MQESNSYIRVQGHDDFLTPPFTQGVILHKIFDAQLVKYSFKNAGTQQLPHPLSLTNLFHSRTLDNTPQSDVSSSTIRVSSTVSHTDTDSVWYPIRFF